MNKHILIIFCFGLLSTSILAQTKPKPTTAADKNKAALDTVQYSLGVYLMQQAVAAGYKIDNPTLFKKGIDDVLQKKSLLVSSDVAQAWLVKYQQVYAREKGKQLEAMLFAQAKSTPGMMALPSGLNYTILTAAQGIKPNVNDTIIINVIGKLPEGTIFQDSNKDKASLISVTGNLIPGLKEILQLMPQGSVWRVLVPAALAYGDAGNGTNIPTCSALVFDVALVEVRRAR